MAQFMTAVIPAERDGAQTVVHRARSSRAGVAWTSVGLFLAVAIVAGLALSIVGAIADQPLTPRQRVFTTPITAVTVDVATGEITVERSAGVDTVVTTSGVHGLTNPTDEEHVVGHTLIIRSNCGSVPFNDRCRRNYVLHLQPEVALTAVSGQGDVSVAGMDGSLSVHSGQGDVTITGGSAALRASSGQGDVTVSRSAATSVAVHSDQGDVAVDLIASPRRITATSDQGDVTVGLPRGPNSYRVHANSDQGNVSNTVDSDPTSTRIVSASSDQGDVTVGYRSR
jgi:Putative adhesin